MNSLLLIALAALLAVSVAQTTGTSVVKIYESDYLCRASTDCAIVITSCNSLDCGVALNKTAQTRINNERWSLCPTAQYQPGDYCKPSYAACVEGRCMIKVVPFVSVDSNVQTCKADSDCGTFQQDCRGTPCCSIDGIVGVSSANLAALETKQTATCAGVPKYDCTTVRCMQYPSNPTCVSGYCTINGAPPLIVDPMPTPVCDPKLQPNSFCTCSLYKNTDGSVKADWACPLSCPGSAPAGCKCTLAPSANGVIAPESALQWVCENSLCGSTAAPSSNCYCGVDAGYVVQPMPMPAIKRQSTTLPPVDIKPSWICPKPPCCDGAVIRPADSCAVTDSAISCTTNKDGSCSWNYECPPPPTCTCVNQPLPKLDPAVDGCTTEQAKWYCSSNVVVSPSGTIGGSTGAGEVVYVEASKPVSSTASKRQVVSDPVTVDCGATWQHVCNVPDDDGCVEDFSCGPQCLDASLPRPMYACMLPPYDPVTACQDSCLDRFATCGRSQTGSTSFCAFAKNDVYYSCMKTCEGVAPVDKCSYLGDKCNCEANGCGWCESTVNLEKSVEINPDGSVAQSMPVGFCASLNSQASCLLKDRVYTTAPVASSSTGTSSGSAEGGSGTTDPNTGSEKSCPIVVPVDPKPLPVEPPIVDIDVCFADTRCASPLDLNTQIKTAVESAPAGSVEKNFNVIVIAVINSNSGIINLQVDVSGERAPTAEETGKICSMIAKSVSTHLKFDSKRVSSCTLSKVTNGSAKRSIEAVSNSYVANIRVAGSSSSASSLAPAVVLALGAAAIFAF